jgi:uncharacterized protein DUF6152
VRRRQFLLSSVRLYKGTELLATIVRRLSPRIWLAFFAGSVIGMQAQAHHSWARYDGDNVITITGVITKVEWASPHVVMHFTVTDDSDQRTEWTMEMDPPTLLNRYGLRHDAITAGMQVIITGVRARSGAPMMRAVTIELPDGTKHRVSSRV